VRLRFIGGESSLDGGGRAESNIARAFAAALGLFFAGIKKTSSVFAPRRLSKKSKSLRRRKLLRLRRRGSHLSVKAG
jgi:hypothetical protein